MKDSLDIIKNTSAELINSVEAKFKELLEERDTPQKEKTEEITETVQEKTEITNNQNNENIEIPPKNQAEYAETDIKSENQDYIMPDNEITVKELNEYGYSYENMLPLTQKRALELFDSDNAIYLIYPDNTEGMIYEREEILNAKEPVFGIEKADWEASKEYKELKAHLENEKQQENKNTFSIYQLKDNNELRNYRFASFDGLKKSNLKVEANNYELVYKAPLSENDSLDSIYNKFNIDRPEDFTGHSLSVSDIVVFEKDGEISSHYVDSFGFKELPVFLGNEKFPPEKEVSIDSACYSNYKGLTAFVGSDDYVYLGKNENYQGGNGIYDNSDNSLIFVSDNKDIYGFLYGDGYTFSQQNMIDNGIFTVEDYREFDRLQSTVLKDLPYKDGFEGIKFENEPFVFPDKIPIVNEEVKQDNNKTDVIADNTPTVAELEAEVKAGNSISLLDLANAVKNEKPTKRKKPSIMSKLKENKKTVSEKEKPPKEDKKINGRDL